MDRANSSYSPCSILAHAPIRERGFDVKPDILTIDEAKSEILRVLRGKGKC